MKLIDREMLFNSRKNSILIIRRMLRRHNMRRDRSKVQQDIHRQHHHHHRLDDPGHLDIVLVAVVGSSYPVVQEDNNPVAAVRHIPVGIAVAVERTVGGTKVVAVVGYSNLATTSWMLLKPRLSGKCERR